MDPLNTTLNQLSKDIGELKPMKPEVEGLKQSIDEIKKLTQTVTKLESQNKDLEMKLGRSEKKCAELEERIISMESASRRNNLKFFKIAKKDNNENCEQLILDACKLANVEINSDDIERAHRTGNRNQKDQPIIAKFHSYKARQKVIVAKNVLRNHGVLVVEDFPKEILQRRKTFNPILDAVHSTYTSS